MSIRLDGKTYTVIVNYKVGTSYKRKVKRGFTTKKSAQQYEAQLITQLSAGYTPDANNVLFIDYYDKWLTKHLSYGLKPQTVANHKWTQQYVHTHLSGITLAQMDRNRFQQIIDQYALEHKASTTKQVALRIGMPLKEAFNTGVINVDPTYKIKINGEKSKDSSLKFLEEDELNQLLSYIESDTTANLYNFVIYTLALSGARAGEALALTFSDINETNKTLRINKTKTNIRPHQYTQPKTSSSIRTISMPDRWFTQLAKIKATYSDFDEHFFGESTDQSSLLRRFKKILSQLGIKQISLHGLRHTHASYLINHNVDIAYVSERLGHSNITVTQNTYFHLLQKTRQSEANKAINLLNKS
ncbi:integrase [Weissella oryzae SG25]|uniref:Integrase n=1 Tax=Weissella oryzae (strain DSM 25784 / JCM 18191 / LMG 30913 / SG25) TaxID=1329250 RepID=A0A069D383_WEIOS|nr:site-specific integrase [Weissella oryzae]GAK31836.1 integrase [Weissella oryzae SG25]